MKITVAHILPENVSGNFRVRVNFWDSDGPPHASAEAMVYVPIADSIAEVKRRAIEQARNLFEKALAAPAEETPQGT